MFRFILLIALLLFSEEESFKAKVIGVTDGDTIIVLSEENKQIKIRLEGIDCPESNQDFGSLAKQATVNLCFQKFVTVDKTGEDLYGRTLAYVYVEDLCINKELIRIGMAWHFKKYNKNSELSEIELKAKNDKVGIWSCPNPIAPWKYRL